MRDGNTGLYGLTNTLVVSDPDMVLIGNQWWMIFATGPTANPKRAIERFAAYLPPGAIGRSYCDAAKP